jgi:hypothetical protein
MSDIISYSVNIPKYYRIFAIFPYLSTQTPLVQPFNLTYDVVQDKNYILKGGGEQDG